MKFDSKKIGDIEYIYPYKNKYVDSTITDLKNNKFDNANKIRHFISGRMTNQDYVVDVGCHIGLTSLWIANYQARINKVIAIDGSTQAVECLKESIVRNNLSNIEPIQAVVSHSNFKCSFHKNVHNQNVIRQPVRWYAKALASYLQHDTTRTLDEIIGDKTCSFISIDVNGHASAVLTGAVQILERDRPVLLIAYNSNLGTMGHTIDTIYDLDYEPYYLDQFNGNVGSQTKTLIPVVTACTDCGEGYFLCYPTDDPKYGLYVDTRKVSE